MGQVVRRPHELEDYWERLLTYRQAHGDDGSDNTRGASATRRLLERLRRAHGRDGRPDIYPGLKQRS